MSDDHSVQGDIANDLVVQRASGPADAPASDSAGIDSDHSGTARETAGAGGPAAQGGPVMDGATDDMSDSGTPKTEAQDLEEAGRGDEIEPPDRVSDAPGGLGDDPEGDTA